MLFYALKFLESEHIEKKKQKPQKDGTPTNASVFELEVGDVVKFGRVCYRVSRIYQPHAHKHGPIIRTDDKGN